MNTLTQARCGDLKHAIIYLQSLTWAHTKQKEQICLRCETDLKKELQDLTDKLWCPKDVLELVSCFNLMSNPKIDQLDPGVGDVLVQQHYILRLKYETGQKTRH